MAYKYILNLALIIIILPITGGCLEGGSLIDKSDLPQGFPQDFPFESSLKNIYVENESNSEQNLSENFYHLSFESEKSHEKLYKWYKKNVINSGWQITGHMLMDKKGKVIDDNPPEIGPLLFVCWDEAMSDNDDAFNEEHGLIVIQLETEDRFGTGLLYFKNKGENTTMDIYLWYLDLPKL